MPSDREQHRFVEAGSRQSEPEFPGTATSPASVSRGSRTTDGSQRRHVLNPVCRWTPVVVLNLTSVGSRERREADASSWLLLRVPGEALFTCEIGPV